LARAARPSSPKTVGERGAFLSPKFLEHLEYWSLNDEQTARRLFRLIREILRSPFHGTGKPEALKGDLAGCWSRRLTREDRIVYRVSEEQIEFLQGRFHY
jgi:toxin YoeB